MRMASPTTVFEEFKQSGDIECYLERLNQHFIALDIPITADTAARRRAILLSSIGAETYKTLRDLCFPDAPHEKDLGALVDLLKKHYKPHRLVVAERFRFHSFKQGVGQTITEYAAQLKELATHCHFEGDQLKQSMRDRFICGMSSEGIQQKLLSKDYTFDQALNIALAEEAASKQVHDMGSSNPGYAHKVGFSGSQAFSQRQSTRAPVSQGQTGRSNTHCDRCGLNSHNREECRHKNATCFKCGKTGHLKLVCRSSNSDKRGQPDRRAPHGKLQPRGRVRYLAEDDGTPVSDQFVDSVFTVGGDDIFDEETVNALKSSVPALKVPVIIQNVPMEMEVDTGVVVSIMNFEVYERHFRDIKMKPVRRKLYAYSGTPLPVEGQITVQVKCNGQTETLPIVVVQADKYAPPLFGRDWLSGIRLDWPQLFATGQYSINVDLVEDLKERYHDVFQPGLGPVQGVRATLHVKDDAVPSFHKSRAVPFSLRTAVDKELTRLHDEGVIYPVDFSEWGTPLVCIPKTDGTVRLCGDYKVSVNKVIHTDQYPIPTPEEVFAKMEGGDKFFQNRLEMCLSTAAIG